MVKRRDVKAIERDILAAKQRGDKDAEKRLRDELRQWWKDQWEIAKNG